ncbi:hypothetical protein LI071_15255 [Bacillus subtilis]|uniref:hypothetical protein n=1 Tax=Bacillus subtilis TaxID=1423 RepID=UPI001D06DF64|nr:hypothetical protein [Bacillus subtilis]MCB7162029.1 hypothetical protein [Bacillus subtilis]MCB7460283.1 hypothetical protein [Bacillus subtilis]
MINVKTNKSGHLIITVRDYGNNSLLEFENKDESIYIGKNVMNDKTTRFIMSKDTFCEVYNEFKKILRFSFFPYFHSF